MKCTPEDVHIQRPGYGGVELWCHQCHTLIAVAEEFKHPEENRAVFRDKWRKHMEKADFVLDFQI
jgi:hypothetical protein